MNRFKRIKIREIRGAVLDKSSSENFTQIIGLGAVNLFSSKALRVPFLFFSGRVIFLVITAVRTRTGRGPGDQGSKSGDYLFKVGYDEDHSCTLGWLDNENENERDKGE